MRMPGQPRWIGSQHGGQSAGPGPELDDQFQGPNGKKAWISSEITHVKVTGPDPAFAAFLQQFLESIGTLYTMVYDQGRNGEDVMHTEPMNVPCGSGPVTLSETVVRNGNFSIR